MSDITNEENTPITVEIPITIYTEYSRKENERDYSRIRIEQTMFHIQAITYFMKMAARGHSLLDLATDQILLEPGDVFENLQLCCQLIDGLTQSVEPAASRLIKAVESEIKAVTAKKEVCDEQ